MANATASDSLMRCAALPVGAQIFTVALPPVARNSASKIVAIVNVLPVPGPPERTVTLCENRVVATSRWRSDPSRVKRVATVATQVSEDDVQHGDRDDGDDSNDDSNDENDDAETDALFELLGALFEP